MHQDAGLRVDCVSHSYGNVQAVSNVSLAVARGELHCLLGQSGSGKSTLLRVVAGLERQQHGTIKIDGQTVSDEHHQQLAEERSVGLVFQDYALFPHLSALGNVLFGMRKRRSRDSKAKAAQLLIDVGLADRITALPHTLSGGEQQRVALARALARSPRVMLLDEPFSGLDSQLRSDVRVTTLQVLRAARIATLMVTHDPAEAICCADRISIMDRGTLIQTDEPNRVYHYPANEKAAQPFGIINQVPAVMRDNWIETPYGKMTATVESGRQAPLVYLRPEQFQLVQRTIAGATGCRIERAIPEGATILYVIRTAEDATLFVRALSTDHIDVEQPCAVRLRPAVCAGDVGGSCASA